MRTRTTRQTPASLVIFIAVALMTPTLPASQPVTANGRKASVVIAASRSFRMGFTGFVYDITPEAVNASHELFMAWRDCGLLDENGKARPALRVWKDYFDLPLSR